MIGSISRNALILSCFAVGTAATLALTNLGTQTQIQCNRQQALADSLGQVMPASHSDNNLLADRITVQAALLGRGEHHIYRARLQGETRGAVLEATAADGYGGAISLIVGVDTDGQVLGVRVVPPHNETPGLGDKIETRKSDWILTFNGRSLQQPDSDGWAVRKDGGEFDSFTGATITPRAIVQAVHRTLQYVAEHPELFQLAAQDTLEETCNG